MSIMAQRVLGPNRNRLLLVTDDADTNPAEPMPQGMIRKSIATKLLASGWSQYTGPAQAKAGWVVPGTDAALLPPKQRAHD